VAYIFWATLYLKHFNSSVTVVPRSEYNEELSAVSVITKRIWTIRC